MFLKLNLFKFPLLGSWDCIFRWPRFLLPLHDHPLNWKADAIPWFLSAVLVACESSRSFGSVFSTHAGHCFGDQSYMRIPVINPLIISWKQFSISFGLKSNIKDLERAWKLRVGLERDASPCDLCVTNSCVTHRYLNDRETEKREKKGTILQSKAQF